MWSNSILVYAFSVPVLFGRLVVTIEQSSRVPLFDFERKNLQEDSTTVSSQLLKLGHGSLLPSGACRSYPGDETWPAKEVWDTFNDALGDALIPTIPIAASCYKNWDVYDEEKCDNVVANFNNPYFHEADPTSMMWPIWQGRTCLPTEYDNGTCTLGAYPAYAVNVSSVTQIQLAVNFARNANLRLVIKNTGHCYLGKSGGAGALSVWTHNLKDIQYLPDFRSPSYRGPALKVGAGVTVREVYDAAYHNNGTVLGSICESVGFAGGYLTGGGHSPLVGLYGMAADQVLGYEVVTADGKFITANESSNTDLYWALRGGGGSTFGVTTSVIVRVHPKVQVVTSSFTFGTSANVSNETFWLGMEAYFEQFIPFTDAGTYSWFMIDSSNASHLLLMQPFFAPNHTLESFNQLVNPWFNRLHELGIPFTPNTTYYDDFHPAYNDNFGIKVTPMSKDFVGTVSSMPGNRLFPRGNWEDPEKFNATFQAVKNHGNGGDRLFGYHIAPQNRLGVDNAVSSAWRNTIAFLITGSNVPPNATPDQLRKAHEETNALLAPWREVAPASEGGGSYLNEAHVMEPHWQQEFYGEQYAELLRLKHKWDPYDVFYATTGVGSEAWEVRTSEQGVQTQNGRLCRL